MGVPRNYTYQVLIIISVLCVAVKPASYQRYDETTRYPTYSTISNLYNQYPYKTSYSNDIATFPEVTRYPNYNQGLSTTSYQSYNTQRPNIGYYQPEYSTTRYNDLYSPGYNSYEKPFMSDIRDYCVDRTPQHGIRVDNLMGMWYGVEYIPHLAGDARIEQAKICIVIHIAEPKDRPSTENQVYHVQHINAKFRQDYRHLRLLWDEGGRTTEYSLYFRNDTAGYWQVVGGNNTFTNRYAYQNSYPQLFSGTIQVLKAVYNHLVLNFCQEGTNGRQAQLYTVVFSREPAVMARWEIESVNNMLQNKKLSVATRRYVCGNNAANLSINVLLLIILGFLITFRSLSNS